MSVHAMSEQERALQQRRSALQRANEVRLAAVAVRREVAAGSLRLADALADERAASLDITALLMQATPEHFRQGARGGGRGFIVARLGALGIAENKRVGTLTDRQRGVIAEAFEPVARVAC